MIVNRQLDLVAPVTVSCQKLLDRIPHLAWLMSDGGEILTVNQQWCDYIGVSKAAPTEDRERPWIFTEILHAEEQESFLRSWQEARSLQLVLKVKIQLQSCTGNWEWFEVELDPDGDELGRTTWIGTAIKLGTAVVVSGRQQSPQFLAACDRQTIDALQESEQKFRAIFDCAFQFVGLAKPDGTLIEVNLTALKFGGIEAKDAIDRLFWEVPGWSFAPAVREQLREWTAMAAGGEFIRQEIEIVGADDRSTIFDFSLTPIRNDRGEVILLIPEGRDITQVKQAEIERIRTQLYTERLSIAMRVAKAGAWNWDLRAQQFFWTPEFESLFDYDPGIKQQIYSEWSVDPWSAFGNRVHPDDRDRVETIWQHAIAGKLPECRCEYRIVLRNGQIRWIDAVGELHCDAQGEPRLMSGLVYDITDRQQASEELFRHTFEHIPLGFNHVALDGSLLWVNQKFGEIVGRSKAELLATTFQSITEPADLEEDLALLAQLVNGEIDEYTLEKRYIHKQGHHVWVNLTVALIRSVTPDGQLGIPQYFLGAVKDITDRKQLELVNKIQTADLYRLNNLLILVQKQLQERNQELDRFVSIAAHDLKAPLRAIANLSEWIEEDFQAQIPGKNPQLRLLRQRVKRMDALIDGLLRYSRAGKEKLEIETVNVTEILAETIDSLAPPDGFEIKILNLMPVLRTKKLLLNQVFANLISNAIKHHNCPKGRIEITVEDLGDRHQFSVADDGPGIPEGESRERIFEIFQTLHPAKSSTENTGIGLALVKKIVEGEGGKIWLDHEFIKGCRFYFTWIKTLY